MPNINLAGDKLYNLNAGIEVALIIGAAHDYTVIGDVPDSLKYSGKAIYDEDNDVIYICKSDKSTYVLNNIKIEISANGTDWYDYDNPAVVGATKYLRFTGDNGETYSDVIRVLSADEYGDLLDHVELTHDNPHGTTADQIDTDDSGMGTVEAELLTNKSHRETTDGTNPHQVRGEQILVDIGGGDEPINDILEDHALEISAKISKVAGNTDVVPILDATGNLVAFTQLKKKNGLGDVEMTKSLFIGGAANTGVQSFTTFDDNMQYGSGAGADVVMDLMLKDKFHFTVNHDLNFEAIADDSDALGMPFTVVLKGGISGGTVSFENIPWGADFDDIVLASGDKVMITGYVYSLNEYFLKKIDFS